ncbi:uncharacterized protein V1518DRAFT_419973 [Limtongia smithiae]|uniref:uncharacterized protein n=1 Tax=Limtongia smithiae TaxID=1125753 RepID=UPI0034CEB90F
MSTSIPLSLSLSNESAKKGLKLVVKRNKMLSSSVDDVLKVQGVNWTVRKAIEYVPITVTIDLHINDDGVEIFDVVQTVGNAAKSEEPRTLDGEARARVSSVFGPVISKSARVKVADVAKISPFLAKTWSELGQETAGADESIAIFSYARGDTSQPKAREWESYQTFGFADIQIDEKTVERKYVVRLFFKSSSLPTPLEKRLVYDFVSLV